MRIVSLLPSATDIVAALGAGDELVGVSHSCSERWAHLPILTSTIIDHAASGREIDAQVKSTGGPLYQLNVALLERLAPDVVVSQSLCDVCAVSSGDVEDAVRSISSRPALVNLAPFRLADIPAGFREVGDAIGHPAQALTDLWTQFFDEVRDRYTDHGLRVAFLDWLDPPFAAGHWIPDILGHLGCISALAKPGSPSYEVNWETVLATDADLIIAACCGLDAVRAQQEPLPKDVPVIILEGDELFSRPSPHLMASTRVLMGVLDGHTRSG